MLTGAAVIPVALAGATARDLPGLARHRVVAAAGAVVPARAANSTILTPSARLLRDASTEDTRPVRLHGPVLPVPCLLHPRPTRWPGGSGAVAGLGWAALALTIIAMIGSAGAFLSWPRHAPVGAMEPAGKEQTVEQPAARRTRRPPLTNPPWSTRSPPGRSCWRRPPERCGCWPNPPACTCSGSSPQGPKTVTELTAAAGVPRTVVSQHLAKLRLSGLVDTRKDGRHVIYSLHDGHLVRLIQRNHQPRRPPDHRRTRPRLTVPRQRPSPGGSPRRPSGVRRRRGAAVGASAGRRDVIIVRTSWYSGVDAYSFAFSRYGSAGSPGRRVVLRVVGPAEERAAGRPEEQMEHGARQLAGLLGDHGDAVGRDSGLCGHRVRVVAPGLEDVAGHPAVGAPALGERHHRLRIVDLVRGFPSTRPR